jgi:hypothetical protein
MSRHMALVSAAPPMTLIDDVTMNRTDKGDRSSVSQPEDISKLLPPKVTLSPVQLC